MAINVFTIHNDNMSSPINGIVLSEAVRDGDYVIFAKLNLNNNASKVKSVTCQLKAGEHDSSGVFDPTTVVEDVNVIRLAENGTDKVDMATIPFSLQKTFQGNQKGMVNCIQLLSSEEPPGNLVLAGRARITAIKVDALLHAEACLPPG
jgi:hypothetical protein